MSSKRKKVSIVFYACMLFALSGCIELRNKSVTYEFAFEIKGDRPVIQGRPCILICRKVGWPVWGYNLYKNAIKHNALSLFVLPEELIEKRHIYLKDAPTAIKFTNWDECKKSMQEYFSHREIHVDDKDAHFWGKWHSNRDRVKKASSFKDWDLLFGFVMEACDDYAQYNAFVVRDTIDNVLKAMFIYDRYPECIFIKDVNIGRRQRMLYNSRGGAPTLISKCPKEIIHDFFDKEGKHIGQVNIKFPWYFHIIVGDGNLNETMYELMDLYWRLYCDGTVDDRSIIGSFTYDAKTKKKEIDLKIDYGNLRDTPSESQ